MKNFYTTFFSLGMLLLIQFSFFACSKRIASQVNKNENEPFFSIEEENELKDSIEYLQSVILNSPCTNRKVYFDAIKMRKTLIEKTASPDQNGYKYQIMRLYDDLLDCFESDSSYLKNRKAYDAYRLFHMDKDKYAWLFGLFDNAFKTDSNSFLDLNILPYFDMARRYHVSSNNYSEKEIYALYEKLNSHINYRKIHGEDPEKLILIQDKLSELLPMGDPIDCEFVANQLLPKLDPKYWNEKLANNIMRLSVNCDPKDSVFIKQAMDRLEFCGYKEQAKTLKDYLEKSQ